MIGLLQHCLLSSRYESVYWCRLFSGLLMKCLMCCAVLTTDEEFIERETYLNVLQNACNCCDEIEECFLK